jgi:hypothetical protein
MALRLIDMVFQERDGWEAREPVREHKVLEHRQARLPDEEVLAVRQRPHEFSPGRTSLTAGLEGVISAILVTRARWAVSPRRRRLR